MMARLVRVSVVAIAAVAFLAVISAPAQAQGSTTCTPATLDLQPNGPTEVKPQGFTTSDQQYVDGTEYVFPAGGQIFTQSTPSLTASQDRNKVVGASFTVTDCGNGVPASVAAVFSEDNYAGACYDFETGGVASPGLNIAPGDDIFSDAGPQPVPYFSDTYFNGHTLASVAMEGQCGAQLLLYQNSNFNVKTISTRSCSGFGCLEFWLSCNYKNGLIKSATDVDPLCLLPSKKTVVSGAQESVSISDASLASTPGNPASIPWVQNPNFTSFGVSSEWMPTGGIAALYDQSSYQGNCAAVDGNGDGAVFDFTTEAGNIGMGNDAVKSYRLLRGCANALYFFTGPLANGDYIDSTTHDLPAIGYYVTAGSMSDALGSGTVSVYSGPDYTGTCRTVTGDPVNTVLLHDVTIESVRVGVSCPTGSPEVYLYPQPGFAGTPVQVATDTQGFPLAWDNTAQSLVNSTSQTISVYSSAHYKGSCTNVPPSAHFDDLSTTLIGDGTISSVKLAPCPAQPTIGYGTSTVSGTIQQVGGIPKLAAIIPTGQRVLTVSNHTARPISIYAKANYTGPCQNVPAGEAAFVKTSKPFTLQASNEILTAFMPVSLRPRACPKWIELFDGHRYRGAYVVFNTSRGTLGNFSGLASSLINNTRGPVAVYSAAHARGRCQTIAAGQEIPNLAGSEIGDNQVTSVKLGTPCKPVVLIFQQRNYKGVFGGFGTDMPDTTAYLADEAAVVNNVGHTISLYRQTNYQGVCQNVPANTGIPSLRISVVHAHQIRSVKLSGPCPSALLLFAKADYAGGVLAFATPRSRLVTKSGALFTPGSLVNNTTSTIGLHSAPAWSGSCEQVLPGEAFPNTAGSVPRQLPLGRATILSERPITAADGLCLAPAVGGVVPTQPTTVTIGPVTITIPQPF
jgi:hypothetical protein